MENTFYDEKAPIDRRSLVQRTLVDHPEILEEIGREAERIACKTNPILADMTAIDDGPGSCKTPVGDEIVADSFADSCRLIKPVICCDCGLTHVLIVEHWPRERRLSLIVAPHWVGTNRVRALCGDVRCQWQTKDGAQCKRMAAMIRGERIERDGLMVCSWHRKPYVGTSVAKLREGE